MGMVSEGGGGTAWLPKLQIGLLPLGTHMEGPMAETLPGPAGDPPGSTGHRCCSKQEKESSAELSGRKGYFLASRKDAFIRGDESAPSRGWPTKTGRTNTTRESLLTPVSAGEQAHLGMPEAAAGWEKKEEMQPRAGWPGH